MKFEMNVGTDYSTVTKELEKLFYKLGGDFQPNLDKEYRWTFPSFITPEVIEQVIHNTCFVCGGLMKTELKDVDNIAAITVRKCSSCGHSHT